MTTAEKTYHHGDLRLAILQAAERKLDEQSIQTLSIRELAREAGVSAGAPYHHFGDRDGLLVALASYGFEKLVAAIDAAPVGDLGAKVGAYVNFARDHRALHNLMFSDAADDADDSGRLDTSRNLLLTHIREDLRPEGCDRSDKELNDLALAVWCFLHGVCRMCAEEPMEVMTAPDDLQELIMRSIKALKGR